MRQGVFNRSSWLAAGTATITSLLLAGCAASMTSTVATPVFTPAGGSFTTSQTVTVGDTTPGAVLHCTTDGSAPTASSPVCSQPVTVYKSETLGAVAVLGDKTSAAATAAFTIALPAAATPVISPATGTFTAVQMITISDSTTGAVIYYTTDGSTPTASSPVYGGPIMVGSTETIKAIAVSSATTLSGVATATFTINLPSPTPVISPAGGTFTSVQAVTITDAAAGAAIYFTTDGTAPTMASAHYSGTITVGKSETITAIAIAAGSSASASASAVFIINLPPAAMPVISPAGGTFTTVQTVTLSDSTAGSSIYYTVDGTTPTAASLLYSAPLTVSNSESVKAIAVATGLANSAVASAAFTINLTVAVPVIVPGGGTFTSVQAVSISDATPATAIYYTLDGSAPTTASTAYTAPITVGKSETVNAMGVATGYANSPVASAAFVINLPAAATPVISPAGGTFTTFQSVTLTDATAGSIIYYTIDGSTPSTASTAYTAPITVMATETIRAVATSPSNSPSGFASATFTINLTPAAAPVVSPAGGTFTSTQTVSITDATAAAVIYYTVDGSIPTAASLRYTAPFTADASETVKAIATATGFSTSAVSSVTFTFNQPAAATPVISPAGGTFTAVQTVVISDTTTAPTIYYTVDGSTPTVSSTKYIGPISVAGSETVKAIATATGFNTSAVASALFTINLPAAATPVISPAGGTFTSAQTVTLSDVTTGATLYYTVDGSMPTVRSPVYSAPLKVSATETVKAIATAAAHSTSAVASAAFTINQPAAAAPTFSPAGGSYTGTQTVTLSDTTAGAAIYYTVDGSTPTAVSTMYTAAISVSATETIKAIAVGTGFTNSAVATSTYTIAQAAVATPVIAPNGGTFATAQTVTISDTTTGAAIYYTVDGSAPTAASTKYTAAITVSATEMIRAIAIATGLPNSAVATASFTISAVTGFPLSGMVMSGGTAINGASVQLYAAGTTGYGSAPTALLTTPVMTSATGGFALGFTCPAAPGDQIYLVASGGDAGNGANSGIELMLALGTCANITSGAAVTINEATTVASAYALSQFASAAASGGINIGAPAPSATCFSSGATTCNYVGLANAFKNVANLVNAGSGAALTITPFYTANTVGYLNSSTVPQARINTLADVLASCVDAPSAAGCPSLYTAATPSGGTAPADTLQAILAIAQNPGQNVTALYGLVAATPPYTPDLSATPNDFVLALTYTGGGLGLQAGTTAFQIVDHDLDIDAAGNVWVAAYNSHGNTQASSMIAEFNAAGEALTPATTQTTDRYHVVTYGGFVPGGGVMSDPVAVAIDQSGNAWVSGLDVTEVSPSLSVTQHNLGLTEYGDSSAGVTIDMLGNVFVATGAKLEEIASNGTLLSPNGWNGVSAANTMGYQDVTKLLFDSTGNTLWASDFSGEGDLYQISPTNGQILQDYAPTTSSYTPLVADSSGNIYGCGTGSGSSLNVFNAASTSIVQTFPVGGGRGCGDGPMAIDGVGHIFAYNSTTQDEFFDEFTANGSLISPTAMGYTATSSDEEPVLNAPVAAAIDGSGSLWVVNYDTGTQGAPNNVLVQFIGFAAPVLTPRSLALQNSELATRP